MNQNQELSENIYEKLGIYEQKINHLQKQIEMIKETNKEISYLSEDIEELKSKKDKEILANIGRGIYVKAKLLSEDFLVDIGGKKFVKKDIESTKKLIEKQIKKLDDAEKEINKNLEDIQKEMLEIISGDFKD